MSIFLHCSQQWNSHRLTHLRRLIILAHARSSKLAKTISDKTTRDYATYKPYLVFFGLVEGIYNYFFKVSYCSFIFNLTVRKAVDVLSESNKT